MFQYGLHILCPECGAFHAALIRITLDDAFQVRRVSDIFPETIPLEFYQAIAQTQCPTTESPVKQKKPYMMVLVGVGWLDSMKPQP
jgi:hypothetical protein